MLAAMLGRGGLLMLAAMDGGTWTRRFVDVGSYVGQCVDEEVC